MMNLSGIVGRNRIITSFLSGALFWFFARPSLASIAAGLPFILLGEAIRVWSSGHIRKNQELATTGPYALTRNPLYFGNGLLGFGFVLMSRNGVLLLLFIPLFAFLYRSTIRREEERLMAKFGEQFLNYMQTVPRFFPRWAGESFGGAGFDWGLVVKHREHRTWIGILLVLVLMVIKVGS